MSALVAERPSGLSQTDRFLAFAFAASDLLVEVSPDGAIKYATGAFKALFGTLPDEFVGRNIARLFNAGDGSALGLALSATALQGRLSPLVLRLADAAATPMVLSGLVNPSAPGRLCFTIGRLPSLPAPGAAEPPGTATFVRLAEQRMQAGEPGAMSMLEVAGWSAAQASMPADAQRLLQVEIMEILGRLGGPGSIAGQIASGRYGVLADTPPDLGAVAAELEALLRANPATARAHVQSANMPLDCEGLTGPQAARALRFALARFADGGTKATAAAGLSQGLAEFIASAQGRARSVRTALAENRFRLAYQPVVQLDGRKVHHYEALMRPVFTPGSPIQTTQDFVTFAEMVGLSEELDWAVMQQAVAAVRASPSAFIAVNVSGLSMQSKQFCERATTLLAEQVPAGHILIELTETADIDGCGCLRRRRSGSFRALQAPVCIDDFGAGVRRVPLPAGVQGRLRQAGRRVCAGRAAERAGARVPAVDDRAGEFRGREGDRRDRSSRKMRRRMMRELGVEYGQGWLFGKPGIPAGQLRRAEPRRSCRETSVTRAGMVALQRRSRAEFGVQRRAQRATSGRRTSVSAGDQDLDPDAKLEERRQPGDRPAGHLPQQAGELVGRAVEQPDQHGDRDRRDGHAGEERQDGEPGRRVRGAERDRDRNGAGPGRERQGERVERHVLHADGGVHLLVLAYLSPLGRVQ